MPLWRYLNALVFIGVALGATLLLHHGIQEEKQSSKAVSSPGAAKPGGISAMPRESESAPKIFERGGVGGMSQGSRQKPKRAPMEFVIQDDAEFLYRSDARLDKNLREIKALGFTRLRITASWSGTTRNPESKQRPAFDATDPAAYDQAQWRKLDRVVLAAEKYQLPIMMDIAFWAPYWAVSDPAGPRARFARSNIDITEYKQFAQATVRRYSGNFTIPKHATGANPQPGHFDNFFQASGDRADAAPLPKVSMYVIWNEPNITTFFGPQWRADRRGRVPASPHAYRAMVAATYPAIKQFMPDSTVIIGGLACCGSYGVKGFNGGVPPLQFLREMACVDRKLRPLTRDGCKNFQKIRGDGWAHHPYSFSITPETPHNKQRADQVYMGDLAQLHQLLQRLVKMKRLDRRAADIYINEFGYFSPPSQVKRGVSPRRHAQLALWSYFVAWKLPAVRMHAQFLLHDLACQGTSNLECNNWPTGIFFPGGEGTGEEGAAKPLKQALEAGIFAYRDRKNTIRIWGRAAGSAASSRIRIEQYTRGTWRKVDTQRPLPQAPARFNGIFTARLISRTPRLLRMAYYDPMANIWRGGFEVPIVGRRQRIGPAARGNRSIQAEHTRQR